MSESSIPIGDIIFIAVKPILKIYMILFTGWALVKGNVLSMETSRGISNMTVNALVPCLIFNKIVTNLSGSKIKDVGIVILSSLLMSIVGGTLAFVISKVTPVPNKWYWGLIFGGLFGNIADLPIAYIQSISGGSVFDSSAVDRGATLSCIYLALQSFIIMNLGAFQLVGLDFKEKEEDLENTTSKVSTMAPSEVELKNIVPTPSSSKSIDLSISDGDYDTDDMYRIRSIDSRLDVESYRGKQSSTSFRRVLSHESQYSTRSRRKKQNTQAIIEEYSEAEVMRNQTMDQLAKTISKAQLVGIEPDEDKILAKEPRFPRLDAFIKKYKLGWFVYILENFKRVPSLALFFSFFVAMIPWVRALFVKNDINIREAPDNLPILNFVMDYTAYLGNAAVPMGLLMLGAIIARLEVHQLPKGFWKTTLLMVLTRLCLMPVFGVLWSNMMFDHHWIDDDISRFIFILTWAVPSSTTQVYFTAFYTPLEGEHLQMDCLAVFLLMQYPVLILTLPIVVIYVLKVTLGL